MPLSALALVILAGSIHACWNIAAKKAGGDVRFIAITLAVLMVFWASLGLWVGWVQVPSWGLLEWALVLASASLHIVYFIVLLRGYCKAVLTVVYLLARGLGPLLSSMVAIFFLGEQISALGLVGILVVVGGVFLIAGGPGLWKAAHDPQRQARVRTGFFLRRHHGIVYRHLHRGGRLCRQGGADVAHFGGVLWQLAAPGFFDAHFAARSLGRLGAVFTAKTRRFDRRPLQVRVISDGAVCPAGGSAVARSSGARSVHAVCGFAGWPPAGRKRPGPTHRRCGADRRRCHGFGLGLS